MSHQASTSIVSKSAKLMSDRQAISSDEEDGVVEIEGELIALLRLANGKAYKRVRTGDYTFSRAG